jgi:hypothetical protein
VLLAAATAPEPLPVHDLVEADLWGQLPADLPDLLTLVPRADLYRARMKCRWPFTRRSRVSDASKGDGGNECREAPGDNRHPSMASACWTGAMAGSRAALLRDAPPMCDVAQVRAAVARSKQRGRVAIVIADNLKTHTAAGSLLVRSLRSRVEGPVVSGAYAWL